MSDFPTGTVTLLFTDIEGSSRLWEDHPVAMRPALARHDALLREAVGANGGYVFKTVGDAFCAAFATGPDALAAALGAQRALAAESWPVGVSLGVRMALHTGAAEEREGDYFGPPLNRIARLLSVAHGRQTLVSAATQELTRDFLPAGAALIDLGQHRLKDLGRPEHVFQLDHADLRGDFPPLRSLDNPELPNNLPEQATSFVGREKEAEYVRTLMEQARVVTLTGTGGAGKSRLSLHVAAEVLDQYSDGAWLIELASTADPSLVPKAVADVLSVREEGHQPITATLTGALKHRRLLLILDNCEHVLTSCAALVTEFSRSCPGVHVLASSREALGVVGEQIYRVPSLSLPDLRQPQTVQSLSQFEAVRLFIDRIKLVQPAFIVTEANAPALAQVCYHLDGIPLAIELAAARARALPVEEISRRLGDRFRLLTGGSRMVLPRQQTLRATLDWSHNLLSGPERVLFRRLSIFNGGWALEDAEAVCVGSRAAIESWEVLDILTSLVDKSLVVYVEEKGKARYGFLETVRQYSQEKLTDSGETEGLRDEHLRWFSDKAAALEPPLSRGERGFTRDDIDLFEVELGNFRSALEWSGPAEPGAAPSPDVRTEQGLRLLVALGAFWTLRGYWNEALQRLQPFIAEESNTTQEPTNGKDVILRTKALFWAGRMTQDGGDRAAAAGYLEEALRLFQAQGSETDAAAALCELGWTKLDGTTMEEGLALFRGLGDRGGIGWALERLAQMVPWEPDPDPPRMLLKEAIAIERELGAATGLAWTLMSAARMAMRDNNFLSAYSYYEEATAIHRRLGNPFGIALALSGLASAAGVLGTDLTAVRQASEENLEAVRTLGMDDLTADMLIQLVLASTEQGDITAAQSYLKQVRTTLRDRWGNWHEAFLLQDVAARAGNQGHAEWAKQLLAQVETLVGPVVTLEPVARPEEELRSLSHDQRSIVFFENHTDEDLTLFWLDYDGCRKLRYVLKPGGESCELTYETHPFVLANPARETLGIFVAPSVRGRVVIERAS